MFVGGKWVDSTSGRRFVTYNPSIDEPIAEVPDGNEEDISKAVEAGKQAFSEWSKLHLEERANILKNFAAKIRDWDEIFGMLDALDSGNPYPAMVDDAKKGAGLLDFFLV